jgi:hypothetical protein
MTNPSPKENLKMLTSNYNQLYISTKRLGDLQMGDIFELSDAEIYFLDNIICKFHGLKIEHIGDCITGKVLGFDYKEWKKNKPIQYKRSESIEMIGGNTSFKLFDELITKEIKQ